MENETYTTVLKVEIGVQNGYRHRRTAQMKPFSTRVPIKFVIMDLRGQFAMTTKKINMST